MYIYIQKWRKWDLQQDNPLHILASYLFRIEKELRGLVDGQWQEFSKVLQNSKKEQKQIVFHAQWPKFSFYTV